MRKREHTNESMRRIHFPGPLGVNIMETRKRNHTDDLNFPGPLDDDQFEQPPRRILTFKEISILSEILTAITEDNFNETMMKILFTDGNGNTIQVLADKFNALKDLHEN